MGAMGKANAFTRAILLGVAGIALGIVATFAGEAAFMARNGGGRVANFIRSVLGTGPAQVDASQSSVVRQIQQLERLETVVYSLEKIISGRHESPYLPKFLIGDRLLLIVHGEVIAGVNLRKIGPSSATVSQGSN